MDELKVNKNSIVVRQYTTKGEFIAEYKSITHASKENGIPCPTISNALWCRETHLGRGFLWLKDGDDINECLKKIEAEKKRKLENTLKKYGKKKREPYIEIDWKVERKGNYIFIEKKSMCGSDLCMRCSLNANGEECLPCRSDERSDGKQGYWRYSKQML